MATKPVKTPDWNTGGANNTEPNSAKKILGWVVNEKPASSFFNWLQKLTGEWLKYLQDGDFVADAGSTLFGVQGTGDGVGDGVRGNGGSGGGRGGSFQAGSGGGGDGAFAQGDLSGAGLRATGGASGAGVIGHSNGSQAGVDGLGLGTGPGVKGTGNASAPGVRALKGTGTIGVDTDGTVKFTSTNPATTFGAQNQFTALGYAKAWVVFDLDGAGNIATVDACNIGSLTLPGSDVIHIPFTQPFLNQSYAIVGRGTYASTQATAVTIQYDNPQTGYFEFKAVKDGGAAGPSTYATSTEGVTARFHIVFFGAQ